MELVENILSNIYGLLALPIYMKKYHNFEKGIIPIIGEYLNFEDYSEWIKL